MEIPVRNYKLKDVDMLISAATITESAINNKTALQAKRSTWADPFFKDFQTKIDQTIQTHLGVDSAKELREATQIVYSIQANAMRDLAEVKVQIDEDFKQDKAQRTEILNTLGFTNYYIGVRSKDQEALINLLYQFKTNLTTQLKTTIVNKGTAAESLETILNYADTLKNANVTQEGNKGTRKEITLQAIKAFNEIYDQAISIAKIAAKIFIDNPALKDQFSFNKVSKNLNNTKKTTPES
jgi:hypothetical protein